MNNKSLKLLTFIILLTSSTLIFCRSTHAQGKRLCFGVEKDAGNCKSLYQFSHQLQQTNSSSSAISQISLQPYQTEKDFQFRLLGCSRKSGTSVECLYSFTNSGFLDMKFFLGKARLVSQLGHEFISRGIGLGTKYQRYMSFKISQDVTTGKSVIGKHIFEVPTDNTYKFPLLEFDYTTMIASSGGRQFDSTIQFRDVTITNSTLSSSNKSGIKMVRSPAVSNQLTLQALSGPEALFQNNLRFEFLGCRREYETLRCAVRITNLSPIDRRVGLRNGRFISLDGQEFNAEVPCCVYLGSEENGSSFNTLVTNVPLLGHYIFKAVPKNIINGALYSFGYKIEIPYDVDLYGEARFSGRQLISP